MKVVILAGGLGTRMREETEYRPKPMVEIGGRPALWHIMKIFAQQGFEEFIICAGYKGDQIKKYLYDYAVVNTDFRVKLGDRSSMTFIGSHDELGWDVTVVDTGIATNTGGRIFRIRELLEEKPFFCTYGDGIAPVDIRSLQLKHQLGGRIATVTYSVLPSRFGLVELGPDNAVLKFVEKPKLSGKVSIGYFAFEPLIFDYLSPDCVLETEVMSKLVQDGELNGFAHEGFWQPMDTARELKDLQDLWDSGRPPWKIW